MVIDLRLMREVKVDVPSKTITFGGGCLWSDVDEEAARHGLATPGGTVNHTGVGGLVLGGGFGWLSPKHGLTIDVLLSVEVVLANGDVVTASPTSSEELFWALRGAGTSFGVATSFTSRCFPQGPVFAGILVYPPTVLAQVVEACNAVLAKQDGDQAMMLVVGYSPPPDRVRMVAVQIFHNGGAAEGEKVYAPLIDLGPLVKQAGEMPYSVVNSLPNGPIPHGGRYQFGAANVTWPVKADVVQGAADQFWEGVERLSKDPSKEDIRGSIIGFELFPNDKAREVPPESTAFSGRGKYFNVALLMNWLDPINDKEVREFKQKVAATIRDKGFEGDKVGSQGVGQYNNYLESSISAEAAFGANAKRLKELKQRFDPENHFDKLWKLSPK